MTKIWERLFIGSIADAEELAGGNPEHITTVVSLSEIPVDARRASIAYLHYPVEDAEPISVRQFDRILDAIAENIRWGRVLLNCSVGVSRAPSLAAAYMDAVGYRNLDAALKEIKQLRPFIRPSSTLLKSLKEHLA